MAGVLAAPALATPVRPVVAGLFSSQIGVAILLGVINSGPAMLSFHLVVENLENVPRVTVGAPRCPCKHGHGSAKRCRQR